MDLINSKSKSGDILISVVIPAYNSDRFICKCIDSLLKQSFENLEIICIDDGSIDSTPQILDEYAARFANVRVVHQENKGQGAARNTGVLISKGKYIGFVDSDDFVAPDMYLVLYRLITSSNAGIAVCRAYTVNEYGNDIKKISMWNSLSDGVYGCETITNMDFFNNKCSPVLWDKLISREIATCFLSTHLPRGQDFITLIDYMSIVDRIAFTSRYLYFYRHHINSVMAKPESSYVIKEDFKTEKLAILKIRSYWNDKPISQLYYERIKKEWKNRLNNFKQEFEFRKIIEQFVGI